MNIAITQRINYVYEISEARDCLDQKLNLFVQEAGHTPVPLPNVVLNTSNNLNTLDKIDVWIKNLSIRGILLSGGENYNEKPERDLLEFNLITYAIENNIPLLGICRGMQIISKKFGVNSKKITNHVAVNHKIVGDINEIVNSYHNYSIESCPKEFNSIAISTQDNEIEAIRHKKLPIEGWMWHPEREIEFKKNDLNRFNNIFI